jgi:flagellar motor switch protein FliN/FliY
MSSQTSAVEFLCKEFCEAVGTVFEQTAGEFYSMKQSGSAGPTASAEALEYELEFSGKVSGTVCVQIDSHSAAVLATKIIGGSTDDSLSFLPEHEDAVLEIVSQTAGVMATSLRTRFGSAEIRAARKQNASAAFPVTITLEQATGADRVSLVLFTTQSLLDSFTTSLSGSTQPPLFSPPESPAPLAHETISESQNLRLIMDVELNLTLRFGQRILTLSEVADLATGSVVELDRMVDEPVELLLEERVIARGEVVIVDGNYGLRITEIAPIDQTSLLSA